MTVTNNYPVVAHIGNGVTTTFPFSFTVEPKLKALLVVYLQDATTFITVKTLAQSEFTATFNAAGDGSVTYNPAGGPIPSTRRIVIERNVPYIQELELTRYGGYDGTAIMSAFDKQEMQIQQIEARLDQAVTVPFGVDSNEFGELVQAAAGYAEDAQEAAEEAEGYRDQAAQYMADAEALVEIIDGVLPDTMNFTGDGVETEFDLGNVTMTEEAIDIFISGVYQHKNTYTVVAGVLTFSEAPPDDVAIEVKMAGSHSLSEPPANTTWLEIVGALPSVGNFEGRLVYLSTDNLIYVYDGTEWTTVGTGEGGGGGGGIPDFGYIEPVDALPDTDNFQGRAVYLNTNGTIYIYIAGNWTAVLGGDGEGGGGGGGTPELPDDASYYYIYPELPEVGLFVGQIAYQELDGKLYTWNGTEWMPLVTSEDVNFPDGFTGVQIVTTLPASDNFEGRIVYLNTDGKLYRYTATGWTRETAAADLTGQITSTQISDGSISTPKLQAGAVVASKISSNAITSDAILAGAILTAKLAAGAVTADKLGANSVTANAVQAGAITAAKINVTALSAISATLGAVNISSAIMGSLTVDTLNIAGNAVTVQAGAETSGAITVFSSFVNVQTVTISWGSAASVWIFFQYKSDNADEHSIEFRSGGVALPGYPKNNTQKADMFASLLELAQSSVISGAAITVWMKRTAGSGSSSITGRKLMVLAAKR